MASRCSTAELLPPEMGIIKLNGILSIENLNKVYTALQMYFYGIGSSNLFRDLDVIYTLPKEMMFLFEKQPSEMEVLEQPPVMIVGLVTSQR
jgi:hypothetical protein